MDTRAPQHPRNLTMDPNPTTKMAAELLHQDPFPLRFCAIRGSTPFLHFKIYIYCETNTKIIFYGFMKIHVFKQKAENHEKNADSL